MTERKEKGHEGGGRWRKVKKERAREKKKGQVAQEEIRNSAMMEE